MPTSTAITASSGVTSLQRGEHRAPGACAPGRRSAAPACAFSAATGPTAWRPTSRCAGRSRGGTASRSSRDGAADVAQQRHLNGVELAEHHPVEVDLDRRHVGGDAGVVGERRAQHEQAVGLRPMWIDATGMPDRPSTPQASGWASGTRPLALNVVMTGASRCSAKATISSRKRAGAVADDDHGPLGAAAAAPRPGRARPRGGAICGAATRPDRGPGERLPRRPAAPARRRGRSRWATSRCTMACFMASAASSVAFSGRSTVWLHSATALNAAGQRHLLERARTEHLALDLAGERDDRHPVDLGVPQAGQQVGGARARRW